jgi:arylsulfatase A-like enzyme
MADDIVTFADILGQQGYACGYAGKWHLDGTGKPQWEPKRRFGFADNRYMFNRGHWKQLEDAPEGPRVAARDKNNKPTYSIEGANEQNFTTDFLTDKTIDFIKSHKDQSFCYMVSYPDPHGPNTVRAPYDVMFNHIEFERPPTADKPDAGLPSWGKKAKSTISDKGLAKYFGMVMCGEHSRDNKGVPYEASAKIPLVLYYPAKVPAGTLVHEALSSVDFLPTVLRLMEIPTAGEEEGRDASTLFMTGQARSDWQDVAFFRGTGSSEKNWLAAVTRRYKVVYSPKDDPWLFDLEGDPDELVNCYHDPAYKDILRHLAQSLLDYGQRYQDARVQEPSIQAVLVAAATLR